MPYLSNPNSLTGGPFGTTAASNNTGFFSDNTNPSSTNCNALPEPSSNVVAASGKWAGGKSSSKKRRSTKRKSSKKRNLRRRKSGGTSNVPNTPNFATGTALPYNLSALANPVPYWKLDNSTNCADNYNHFTGGKRHRKKRSSGRKISRKRKGSKKRRHSKKRTRGKKLRGKKLRGKKLRGG